MACLRASFYNRFLRVENSLQQVDLCLNAAGKAISMPGPHKSFAPYFGLYAGGGKAAGAPAEEGKTFHCTAINGGRIGAFGERLEPGSFQEGCPRVLGWVGYGGKDAVDTRLVQQAADAGPEGGEVQGSRGRDVKAIDTDRPGMGEEGFYEIHLDRGMNFQQE